MAKIIRYFFIIGILTITQAALVACAASGHSEQTVQTSVGQPEEPGPVLDCNRQKRDLILLGEAEIIDALVGYRHSVDSELCPINPGYGEDFFTDGRWVRRITGSALQVTKGAWRIFGNRVCTRVTPGPTETAKEEFCRQVWRDRSTGKVTMRWTVRTELAVWFFSTYPLVEKAN